MPEESPPIKDLIIKMMTKIVNIFRVIFKSFSINYVKAQPIIEYCSIKLLFLI